MSDQDISGEQNVCDNQQNFNLAFKKALNQYHVDMKRDNEVMQTLVIVLYVMLTIWGLMIAMKKDKQHRVFHVGFALAFGPLYVLSTYAARCGANGE